MANKYIRKIKSSEGHIVSVDVYDVLLAFNVTCPARCHAIKKLLCSGLRGKSELQDLEESVQAIQRSIELCKSNEDEKPENKETVEYQPKQEGPDGKWTCSYSEHVGGWLIHWTTAMKNAFSHDCKYLYVGPWKIGLYDPAEVTNNKLDLVWKFGLHTNEAMKGLQDICYPEIKNGYFIRLVEEPYFSEQLVRIRNGQPYASPKQPGTVNG